MAKVSSKPQVTIPTVIADRCGIRPGDELEWVRGADVIRVVAAKSLRKEVSTDARLRLFDAALARQRAREEAASVTPQADRGWTREELYERGGSH